MVWESLNKKSALIKKHALEDRVVADNYASTKLAIIADRILTNVEP